ncbi:MAG: hypothetical protein R2748_04970 [Bryobacterales bacterium]
MRSAVLLSSRMATPARGRMMFFGAFHMPGWSSLAKIQARV